MATKATRAMNKANTTHGLSHTRFWQVYFNMKNRCRNKNVTKYTLYGKRGIKCNWDTFQDFKADMHESYLLHCKEHGEKNTTIERIDTNGNYTKNNCRWATWKEQASNRRNTIYVSLDGQRMLLTEAAKQLGKTYNEAYWYFGLNQAREALKV